MGISADIVARFEPLVRDLFSRTQEVHIPPIPSSALAATVWAIRATANLPVVVITDGPQTLEQAHQDLLTLCPAGEENEGGSPLLFYPSREASSLRRAAADPEVTGARLACLLRLQQSPQESPVVATCIQAIMQKAVSAERLAGGTVTLHVGGNSEMEDALHTLSSSGYEAAPEVQEKGTFAVKGGLLDVWPVTEIWPLRIEFFGSNIESIRAFDPISQKSVQRCRLAVIPPAYEFPEERLSGDGGTADTLDHLSQRAVLIWSDPAGIADHAAILEEAAAEAGAPDSLISLDTLRAVADNGPEIRQVFFEDDATPGETPLPTDLSRLPGVHVAGADTLQPDIAEPARRRFIKHLTEEADAGKRVIIFFDTPAALDHFRQQAVALRPAATKDAAFERALSTVTTESGMLSEGFASDTLGLVIVAESDLYGFRKRIAGRYDPRRTANKPQRTTGDRIADLNNLEPGDLVVHVEHGLGRYLGLTEIVFNGRRQEVISIEYAESTRLHVPTTHAHLLSRYVGLSKSSARLHRLGGKRWNREKAEAEQSVLDLASSLLQTQAERSLQNGFTSAPDTPWQFEFEASFPYRETADQADAITEVKRDMQSARPMDRLVCGDAGYGKTEVAIRAAFKTVMGGKQAAVLVPTTVLAQQHYETFRERMAPYPIRIEMLSRFCSRSRRDATLRGMADGGVDIVIGTHALIQPGVRFRNLGLAVIDEEQRFGVLHKERLKQIRKLVDVLTLTATPIPRTLYMSLTGARDMSLLQTPPSQRMAIETVVVRNQDSVIREAILRELNREGQVFYLYNRVLSIDLARQRLERVVPEARMATAHGQMSSTELREVMHRFVAGEVDVLLCTTIIESGMDIPRANTILIDRADRFGIADLYQLRGRVGRSNRKAYAYLLIPTHGLIDSDARKRIGAVRKHSSLSAGFSLALRDLELRGAGNILGAAQSGHITAVGFALYCQLLRRTVARLKGEPLPPVIDVEVQIDFLDLSPSIGEEGNAAVIPYAYLDEEALRIGIYRRMAALATPDECASLRNELEDRFGKPPPSVDRLLRIAEMRILAAEREIQRIEAREGKVILTRKGEPIQIDGRFPRLLPADADAMLAETIEIVRRT